ncbi:hypothetical protein ACA583_07725 [Lactiplantibacillus plantarum]|uniref:hypothetical protein n=1 Tax=Lactiplantibacillus plantarum TaxID=1590 RepID=UPI0026576A09|nr:hypothetical protein [Lactiplantibacillus plantarum]MDN7030548.1 hypothetical protein [Lactiplantibacillus plantarum]
MTKRQRNHKVKVYFEQYFKKRHIPADPDGYKQWGQFEPQGKREARKENIEIEKGRQFFFNAYGEYPSKELIDEISRGLR